MNRTWFVHVVTGALLVVLPPATRAQTKAIFHGYIGYGTQSLADINGAIEDDELAFHSLGIPVSFDTFKGSPDFGGGFTFRAAPTIGLGFELGYQGSSVDNRYSDFSGSYSDAVDLRIVDVAGTIEFSVPTAPGLFFGASAGMGFGKAKDEMHFRDFNDSTNNIDMVGNWDGSGFVGGAFAGYRFGLSPLASLYLRGGYRYRNLGTFTGVTSSPQFGSSTSPPQDNAGQPLDFDFSGVYFRAGFAIGLGGR